MDDQRSSHRAGDSLVWLHLFAAVLAALVVLTRTLEVAGCDDQCNFSALGAVTRGFWIADLIGFILTTGIYFCVRSRARNTWLVPAIGISLTLIAFLITYVVMSEAMEPVPAPAARAAISLPSAI